MKTQSRIYKKGSFLCVATVWLLALASPAIPREQSDAPAKPAAAAAAEQSQKKSDSEKPTAKGEKAAEKKAGTKPSPSPRGVSSVPGNRTAPPSAAPPVVEQPTQPTPDLEARIANLEGSYVSQDVFGLLTWPTFILGLFAVLLFIALSLHLLHFFRLSNLTNFVDQLAKSHAALGQAAKGQRAQVNNTAVERLTAELDRHDQVLKQFSTRLNQVDGRLTSNDNQFEDAAHAITLAANWIGQSQLKTAFANDAGGISDSERASAIAMLERYREPFRQNASRVEPVLQALAELVDSTVRSYVSPELCSRLQGLYQGIHRFDQWHAEVEDELNSLQLGSLNQRSHLFHVGQTRLMDEVNQGSMSVAQMVQKSRELTENYFPERAQRPVRERLALADREANLKKILEGACDYLMDWYNSLFQFQNQLEQGQRSAAEAELAAELARVQQLAREALNKYDVQPEAIHIGQTQYDRRLHEAILVRQSQFPLNTVIEIHECGFRKMSTGEALRRPQVSVAGARAV